jgi:hypothetical protein
MFTEYKSKSCINLVKVLYWGFFWLAIAQLIRVFADTLEVKYAQKIPIVDVSSLNKRGLENRIFWEVKEWTKILAKAMMKRRFSRPEEVVRVSKKVLLRRLRNSSITNKKDSFLTSSSFLGLEIHTKLSFS